MTKKREPPSDAVSSRTPFSMLRSLGSAASQKKRDAPTFSIAYAALMLVGPLSLIFAPQPMLLVVTYGLLGAIAGALWLPREMFPAFIGLGVLLLGVDYVTDAALRTAPQLQIPVWQPFLLATTTWIGVPLLPGILRRYRRSVKTEELRKS